MDFGETNSIATFQSIIETLQKRNFELENQLQIVNDEKIALIAKASQCEILKRQLERILSDKDTSASLRIDYNQELLEQNKLLSQKLEEVTQQRDKYVNAGTQNAELFESNRNLEKQVYELKQKSMEYWSKIENLKSKITENSKNDNSNNSSAIVDDLIKKNADLSIENKQMKVQIDVASEKIEKADAEIERLKEANFRILNNLSNRPVFDKNLFFDKFGELSNEVLNEVRKKLENLELRMNDAYKQITYLKEVKEKKQNNDDLVDRINELEEEIQELRETDATPKLSALMSRVRELEEENKKLKNTY